MDFGQLMNCIRRGTQQCLLAVLTVLLWPVMAAAGEDAHPMRFEHLTLDDGLSQSTVVSILQDSEGFMWFGTENGLNRYDGYRFSHFRQERGNAEALRNDFVYDLVEDASGALWVATKGGGLSKFDRDTETFTTYRHDTEDEFSIAGNIVRSLLADSDGSIWVGLRQDGLNRLNPANGKFERFDIAGGGESVFALHKDHSNRLWVGTDAGLYTMDLESGEVESFGDDADQALSSGRIRTIASDSKGRVWVGTYDSGLNKIDAGTGDVTRFRHDPADAGSLADDRVTDVFEDEAKRIWVATTGGLNLLDEESLEFTRFSSDSNDPNSLSSDAVSTLFQDRSGLIWVGTLTSGINKWNPRTWALGLQETSSIAATEDRQPNIVSFATGNDDALWIGTFGDGLIARDREDGGVTHYRNDPEDPASLGGDRVMSLIVDSDGFVWAGTMRGGLSRLDTATGEFTNFRNDPSDDKSLSANGIMALFEDSQGLIWAGTFGGGVSIFDKKNGDFSRIGTDAATGTALSGPRVTALAEDRLGNIWIGTDSGGLNLYERESGTVHVFRYDEDDATSLSSDTVYSLHVDAKGAVWVGTRGAGLDRVIGSSGAPDKVQFTNLSQKDGLSNDVVYGVLSDNAGDLWLSTNYGITQIDRDTGGMKQLHRRHGLQSEEFNFGAYHASADGTLFFGGAKGFNEFEPEGLPVSSTIPPIVLTGFFNAGDDGSADIPSDLNDGIELDYADDSITFEFAALDFISSENNRFMYKLEGFDQDWIDLGTAHRVTYTDLDDGYYLLRIKAANADGVWNEAGFAMPLRVKPAPWDTWWAYVAYAALFVQVCLFLWWGHQRRLRREEEYSHRLEREVSKRTRELAERSEELVELNQSLQESSLSDPLTGLRNRRFVFEEVSRDLETIRRKHTNEMNGMKTEDAADLVFMMIDLDNFKPINDTYGHAAGDQMLLEIRDVLLSTCRRSDFVVRWGGDEFVVVAKQSHPGEAEALAERIRSKIAATSFTLEEGQIVRTTCSIGFVAYPLYSGHSENSGLDEVINLADSLMYEAKNKRDAWVGLLGIDEAATSEGFNTDDIQPSSILFRARRNGRLIEHNSDFDQPRTAEGAA